MADDPESILDALEKDNAQLRRELSLLKEARKEEREELEAQCSTERALVISYADAAEQQQAELDLLRSRMVQVTHKLDEELVRREEAVAEAQMFDRRLQDMKMDIVPAAPSKAVYSGSDYHKQKQKKDEEKEERVRQRASQVSTKLLRVVDQWMRARDLQQALLRGASINDTSFVTLAQALFECPSLQTLDLSQNLITMDSCSDICHLVTTAPNLSFVSLADNLFSLRCLGYFMTAVMERQNSKKLAPLDLLDLTGNEGIVAAAFAAPPQDLLKQVNIGLGPMVQKLPQMGAELLAQVMRALWRFLHDTRHPQVKATRVDDVAFQVLDDVSLKKMDCSLVKILLLSPPNGTTENNQVAVTANLALEAATSSSSRGAMAAERQGDASPGGGRPTVHGANGADALDASVSCTEGQSGAGGAGASSGKRRSVEITRKQPDWMVYADPFRELREAFEPKRDKLKTFNLKQIVTRNGTVLMNMLERLLETTEIDARDVETDQTLLEYACHTGNMGLAKLCYRRGANLSAKTGKGDTAFNIVTRNARYDLMEFLHTYGVKVNSADAKGTTALHMAAANDDVDGVCRLLEWGADVNIKDLKKRTPIHVAAAGGKMKTTMLLLEVGADMNAKDEKEFTAVAHAEANNHFALMDRLVMLGGRGHGMNQKNAAVLDRSKSAKHIGELVVSSGMLKSSSLGRIGKVAVKGLPGPMKPTLPEMTKKPA
mmetsp:Transcript_102865/g.219985  ORF Transcript_102865/g.219985 Transcript_102865/m.219985 type:complete len:716 (-) Transcript_102865:69-2216(-)